MDVWEQVVASAVLGTDRQPLTLPPQSGPLGNLLARLEGADPEHYLLGVAAAVSLYRTVGRTPAVDTEAAPTPCPEDPQPACSPRTETLLRQILDGNLQELLFEWLSLAAGAGCRVPEGLLPALLEAGTQLKALRPAIARVAGVRGRWLARQNPAWAYALQGEASEAGWTSEILEERVAAFTVMRAADPAHARAVLAETWTQESPALRAACLEACATGLSLDDEPFLEAALDDKRKEVRTAAVELLAQMPESALAQRMRARAEACLAFTPGVPARLLPPKKAVSPRLEVILPEACDKAMQRDGVSPKSSSQIEYQLGKVDEKGWWLIQIISCIPPSHWCTAWGMSPVELLNITRKHEWRDVLYYGWSRATRRFTDTDWASAILFSPSIQKASYLISDGLTHYLSDEFCLAHALDALSHLSDADIEALPRGLLLEGCPHPWPTELAERVLARMSLLFGERAAQQQPYWENPGARLAQNLSHFAQSAHPQDYGNILQLLRQGRASHPDALYHDIWVKQFDRMEQILSLRADMYAAFQEAQEVLR